MTYTPTDLAAIRNRVEKATGGPWHSCGEKCDCVLVMHDHGPICEVVKGKWGDDFVSVKLEGGSLERKAVGYMDQITYGEVPLETFRANRDLICNAPADLKALLSEVETLREAALEMAKALTHLRDYEPHPSYCQHIHDICNGALSLPAVQALRDKEGT